MAAADSKLVIYAALIGNGLIAVTKFIAASITGSSAMLSEGIHSLVDTGNQVLLLYGLHRAKKPPDERFPFGHGKEIYFWSFVVAILIFAIGSGISIYEGISHILHPNELGDPTINYIVLALSIIFEGFAWYFALREFRKVKGQLGYFEAVHRGKNPTLFVVLFEDSAAMLGLLVALAGIGLSQLTGDPLYDGIASVTIGFILAGTAIWLAYETKSLLIGESADQVVVRNMRTIAEAQVGIARINEILTLHMGPDFILVNLSIEFTDDLDVGAVENIIHEIDKQLKDQYPEVKRVFIEAEDRSASSMV